MSHPHKKTPVAILGATGYVGRVLAIQLANHPHFELIYLIGSPASVGRSFGEVWQEKEARLRHHYGPIWHSKTLPKGLEAWPVIGSDACDMNQIKNVFSAVPETASVDETRFVEAGVRVISHNPKDRLRYPLVIPEIAKTKPTELMIKMPNCVSIGATLALAPLTHLEIQEVSITTFQSLSGQGDRLYPQPWAIGNVFPIGSDVEATQHCITEEVEHLLNLSIPPRVRTYRVYVQEGHIADIRAHFTHPIDTRTLREIWTTWNPLQQAKPPLLVHTTPGTPKSQDSLQGDGMAVHIGNIQQHTPTEVSFTMGIHNIVRGAAGHAILTALWLNSVTQGGVDKDL